MMTNKLETVLYNVTAPTFSLVLVSHGGISLWMTKRVNRLLEKLILNSCTVVCWLKKALLSGIIIYKNLCQMLQKLILE